MSQSRGYRPNSKPSSPSESQYQLIIPDNNDYIYREADSTVKRSIFFAAGSCSTLLGGCATLLVLGLCFFMLGGVWFFSSGRSFSVGSSNPAFPPNNPAGPVVQSTPYIPPTPTVFDPNQQVVASPTLDPNIPIAMGQPILAADIGMELTVWDIQRNVQPNNYQAAEGLEFVSVSVQLQNETVTGPLAYALDNFYLRDAEATAFPPDQLADNGRRLDAGQVEPGSFIEGDLLFHIPFGHSPLTLVWQVPGTQQTYQVNLQ